MNITRVTVRPVEMNKVKAMVSITIDDAFVVHGLRVVEGERGFFVAMPSRRLPSGEYRDIAHPINTETREMIESMVLEEFKKTEGKEASSGEEEKVEPEEPKPQEEPEEPKPQEEPEEPKPQEEPETQEE
ncbi:MAG TPA: septation regulator SpoVG [Candidatus Subteraquimicrobiales bacterium]